MASNLPAGIEDEPGSSNTTVGQFEAVPVRPRHNGWTAEKQIRFLEALAETACVEEACRRVGVTRQSAYRLRRDPRAISFRDGWDDALDHGLHQLEEAAMSRALHGVPRPIFHKGEQVGEWRHHDERLTMFLLRLRRHQRFGQWVERKIPPDFNPEGDPTWRFTQGLIDIEAETPDEGFELDR